MDAPALQFAFEVRADLGAPLEIGAVAHGERRIIPIRGGTFEGPELRGEVLDHGADWQIVRADGTTEIDTRYLLRTAAGSLIYVVNRGLRTGPPEVLARLRAGENVEASEYYFRAVPQFETSAPELEWLMRAIFVASGERHANSVIVRFWKVL